MKRLCICGGGNLGHVIAGFVAAQQDMEVSLLTNRPEAWSQELVITDVNGNGHPSTVHRPPSPFLTSPSSIFRGRLKAVSSAAEEVIANADMVLLCLPGFAIHDELLKIRPWLKAGACVGSVVASTGFFFEAFSLLSKDTPLFGFQRVPFIARTTQYGKAADLKGYRKELFVAIEQTTEKEMLRQQLERMLKTPIHLLKSHYEVSLTNSNPLLHPSRLYSLWKDWKPGLVYDTVPAFYYDWTDEASEYLIAMDNEFQQLLKVLPVSPGSIPPLLTYYESSDIPSLTRKIRSIPAFAGMMAPMKPCDGGFVPDFSNRYFTEDFPYGLAIINKVMHEKGIPCPTIDRILEWGRRWIVKSEE